MTIASELQTLRNTLKDKIESKYEITCNSTTIKGLIGELNEQIDNNNTITPPTLTNKNIAEQIFLIASYLCDVLELANINANINDGFTSIIDNVDDIVTTLQPITPTISISRNKSSLSSGSSVTLTATVTGDTDHGTPTGKVQFFEGTSTTAFKTVTSSSTTTSSTATFKTTRSKTVSSNTTYKYSAKFISNDNTKYNDSAQSTKVSVKWTAPTGKTPSSLSASASFQGTGLVWSYRGAVGTVKVGTSSGGSQIGTYTTSSGSGSIQLPSTTSFTIYVSDTGDSTHEAGSVSVTATR